MKGANEQRVGVALTGGRRTMLSTGLAGQDKFRVQQGRKEDAKTGSPKDPHSQ
jgi:hypothetical protein